MFYPLIGDRFHEFLEDHLMKLVIFDCFFLFISYVVAAIPVISLQIRLTGLVGLWLGVIILLFFSLWLICDY